MQWIRDSVWGPGQCLQGGEMEYTVLRCRGAGLVSRVSLPDEVREGVILSRSVVETHATGGIQAGARQVL